MEVEKQEVRRTRPLRVLVGCEFSGVVRDAFRARGHDAFSCDLVDSIGAYGHDHFHIKGDILEVAKAKPWDILIAHPPCTFLAVCGARWNVDPARQLEQAKAIRFCMDIMALPIPHIAMENPVGVLSTRYRKPDQYIQPWQYGHGETKKTCLWLKNLPLLKPTNIVPGREGRIWKMGPSPTRGQDRSITYKGIAEAMAEQWGN